MATEGLGERQVAVLIDYENVGLAAIQWLLDQVSDHGRVIVKRAYADWSQAGSGRDQRRQRDQLLELGIEPIHLFHSASGKNSSDIRLAIDAVELMYNSPVDTFVIVSSDTDFVPLVSRLRAAGKSVIGGGRKKGVSQTLVRSCDRYYYLDQASASTKSTETTEQESGESLLVRAVRTGMDAQGQINGGKLMETMQRMDPSFDYRALGYSTFSRYLEASSEVSVTRPRGGGNMSVELFEGAEQPDAWHKGIDQAWLDRAPSSGDKMAGSAAANDAARVLGVGKLSASKYKTLQRLLEASPLLSSRWERDRYIIRRR